MNGHIIAPALAKGKLSRFRMLPILAVLVTLGACAQPAAPGRSQGGGQSNQGGAQVPKVLVVGIQREPTDLGVLFGQGTATTAGGAGSVKLMVHDKLAVEMDLDRWEAQLAVGLPSLEDGSWRVNPDGSMDTTWKLRPNIKWHDGAPFTSADLMFAYQIFMDPDLATSGTQKRFMEAAKVFEKSSHVVLIDSAPRQPQEISVGALGNLPQVAATDTGAALCSHSRRM